ncbi:MAG: hypothetical protein MPK31_01750 [Gammaproteobacteria bacterium]|nr:hypothetical protein [Gammaproteobacteria bacterium]MDA8001743.1 hypothetical protein [Alphaproteobacteria bacterium]
MKTGAKRSILAGIMGVAVLFGAAHSAENVNRQTLCPPESDVPGQTILLVDTTDLLPLLAHESLKPVLKGLITRGNEHYLLPKHKLIVYHVGAEVENLAQSLQVCNPGNPDDLSLWEKLIAGENEAKVKWRKFTGSVGSILRALSTEQLQSEKSPLLETIALVIARHASGIGVDKRKPTNLIVFSDMLQHSARMSHYKSIPNPLELDRLAGYAEIRSDLKGVNVWIYYVQRPDLEHLQTLRHHDWWPQVIKHFGGKVKIRQL